MEMQQNDVALPMRPHTVLGVCEAIGEDFGFNPVLLRVPFGAAVLWSPSMTLAIYLGLGVLVLASRLIFPRHRSAKPQSAAQALSPANEQAQMASAA